MARFQNISILLETWKQLNVVEEFEIENFEQMKIEFSLGNWRKLVTIKRSCCFGMNNCIVVTERWMMYKIYIIHTSKIFFIISKVILLKYFISERNLT